MSCLEMMIREIDHKKVSSHVVSPAQQLPETSPDLGLGVARVEELAVHSTNQDAQTNEVAVAGDVVVLSAVGGGLVRCLVATTRSSYLTLNSHADSVRMWKEAASEKLAGTRSEKYRDASPGGLRRAKSLGRENVGTSTGELGSRRLSAGSSLLRMRS